MADEMDGPGVSGESGPTTDPAAVALALGGASRERADAFLKKQEALIENQNAMVTDQRHHLHEQLKQLRLNIWEKYLGVLLRIATAFIGAAVAAAVAWLIWNAAHSNALVIDAFNVPPDLAGRGLSGLVVAAKLSDKIAAMQADTLSQRPPKSYANGLTDGLKLEIPETGVSLSELNNFLHDKLGHDLHISGEMVQVDNGVALTARVGSDGSATVTGSEADMDSLLQKLAEQVYRITQPYRYGTWLNEQSRMQESIATLTNLALSGPDNEKAWAYDGLGVVTLQSESELNGLALFRRSYALDPNFYLPLSNIASAEDSLGLAQDSQRDYGTALALVLAHGQDYALSDRTAALGTAYRAMALMYRGALLEAAEEDRKAMAADQDTGPTPNSTVLAELLASLHEPGAADRVITENPISLRGPSANVRAYETLHGRLAVALAAQNWPQVLSADTELSNLLAQSPGLADSRSSLFNPLTALALAHLGQFAKAEAQLKATRANCYPCLRARAQVAAMQGQGGRADYWFTHAVAIGPSLPFAESEWGNALLARGKPDDAIAKFKLANQKGPHFADPLEGWGEALMAKNRSDLAVAKFTEAEKYAPNWGRLHLKWGEALYYAGKKDEAAKQFAQAAGLDMNATDKAELTRVSGHG